MSIKYKSGDFAVDAVPVAADVVIVPGDLLVLDTGKAVAFDAASDNLLILGVAVDSHGVGDLAGTIGCYRPLPSSVFESDLDAATDIVINDTLQWYTGQKVKKSGTDAIAVAAETKTGATTICFRFKLPAALVGDAS